VIRFLYLTALYRPLKSTDISEFFTLPEDTTRLENMVKVLKYQQKMRERDILSKTGDLDKSILICEVTRQWGFIARLAPRKYKLKKADLRDSFSEGIWVQILLPTKLLKVL
jgi:hypothetical protein